jgi:PAS domain S-box-containing protein
MYTAPSSKQYSILLIESSELFSKTVFNFLSSYTTYTINQAYTFSQAKKNLLQKQYDIVILGLPLHDAYGDELFDTIQKLSDAKIIILSSETNTQTREDLFNKGILDYLIKDQHFKYSLNSIKYNIEALQNNKNKTILFIVEDSKFIANQLKNILQYRNYQVKIALTAEEGLKHLRTTNINTIILDMELSDKYGLDLLREIKDEQAFCHIPVIIISAANDPVIVRNSLKIGASDFIKKPFNIEEFILKVDLCIETNRKYVEMLCSKKMLEEYKIAIDESSLVSKTDAKGIITYVNETFCKLSGYSKEELLGKPHSIVRHPDVSSSVFKDLWQTIKNKQTWKGIIKNRKKNGEEYYVQSTVTPIIDADHNIVEYIAIRTDITELETYKKLLEDNLNISNNSLYQLTQYEEAITDFIAVVKTNTKNTITYVNENFVTLSGYSKNELLGMSCKDFRAEQHKKNGDCDSIVEKLKNQKKLTMIFENISKTNKHFFTDTHIYPLVDKKGTTLEHLHLMYDITDVITLHKEIENTQKEIIYKMGEIAESRSKETGNHVKRVANYSKLLAQLAGLNEKDADILYIASPMHDIGKVGIPDAILNKPGKLTDEEFEIMKSHSEIGFNILKNSNKPIVKAASVIAYTHHEKFNGTGYPKGTKGKNIHIFGRITAIADVFDALGSDRCYKKAWELEKILELFEDEKGKHFDPELIDLFLSNIDKFLDIRNQFIDINY